MYGLSCLPRASFETYGSVDKNHKHGFAFDRAERFLHEAVEQVVLKWLSRVFALSFDCSFAAFVARIHGLIK